jgi:hypothetical protein
MSAAFGLTALLAASAPAMLVILLSQGHIPFLDVTAYVTQFNLGLWLDCRLLGSSAD